MRFSLRQRLNSFGYAGKGIKEFLRTQHNAWIQSVIAVLVLALSFFLGLSTTEWCLVLFCIGAVMGMEAMNSAVEKLADTLHPDRDEGIGKAKDLAAGAVLIISIFAALIGLILFIPKIISLLGN